MRRVEAVFREAIDSNVEVLLLQEIAHDQKENIRNLAIAAGYEHSFISPSRTIRNQGTVPSSTAIFSHYPLSHADEMTLTLASGATKAARAHVKFNGHDIFCMSVHLVRGAANGAIRLKQATLIEEAATRSAYDGGHAIVGGTFNDISDGDSVRYLKGLKTSLNVSSAFWVDSTEHTEIANTPTTRYQSTLGKEAARISGIKFPELLPNRKLDYLFSRGWVYGTIGTPLDSSLFGVSLLPEGVLSDHFGIMSDFWFPKK